MDIFTRKSKTLLALAVILAFSGSLFADTQPQIDTILTDKFTPGNPGDAKDTFTTDTPIIYIIWKSDQLKLGQKVKSVWIADDTNNIAPPHTKIDEAQLTVDDGMKGQVLSHLPGTYWDGKFTLSKPYNGWPMGKYHAEIYVDNALVKSIPFTVAEAVPSVAHAKIKDKSTWGAIAVDTISHDSKDCAYGIGGDNNKDEAEKYATQYCLEAGGAKCKVVISYEHCGAYALSKNNQGVGAGDNKEIAENQAKAACNNDSCTIVTSDCNN